MKNEIVDKLNLLYLESYDCYGRNVDKAIEIIREFGIKDKDETKMLLKSSKYNSESCTSVYSLICG